MIFKNFFLNTVCVKKEGPVKKHAGSLYVVSNGWLGTDGRGQ